MKGHTNNPNGRPRGIPNKLTTDLRQWITNLIEENKNQIQQDWKSLEPKERIIIFEKLLKYVLPTLQATSFTSDFDKLTEEQVDMIIESLKIQCNENAEHTKRKDCSFEGHPSRQGKY